jgi:energy-coupling factor transport system permease protein
MFVSAIRRANELANAMEARCYRGGDGRTKLKPLKYSTQDVIAYVLLFLYLADMAALRILMSQGLLERIYNMNVLV